MLMLLITAVFVVAAFITGKVVGFLSPSVLFMVMQYIMAMGTLPKLDLSNAADERHQVMLVLTFILLALSTMILAIATERRRVGVALRLTGEPKPSVRVLPANKSMVLLALISVVICIAYYQAVGYNLLLESLMGNIHPGDTDVAGLRLAAYAGDTYYFPGYVNQFKNALLPALATILITWLYSSRKPLRLPISIGLSTMCVAFLMGTGQRGAMVTFIIVLVIYAGYFGRKAISRAALLAAGIGIPVFFIGSSVLGRSGNELSAATGFGDRLMVQFDELLTRILDSNQNSSISGFRYLDGEPVAWGTEWFQSLAGLLPGVPGSSISSEIFAEAYGSTRGTSPPSMWTSIYYNFGILGILLGPILLGILYFAISNRISSAKELNTLMAVGMAGVTALLAMWVAGSPDYLLNNGIVVFIFLWWWGHRVQANLSKRESKLSRKSLRRELPYNSAPGS